jgi:hypothetical protein
VDLAEVFATGLGLNPIEIEQLNATSAFILGTAHCLIICRTRKSGCRDARLLRWQAGSRSTSGGFSDEMQSALGLGSMAVLAVFHSETKRAPVTPNVVEKTVTRLISRGVAD